METFNTITNTSLLATTVQKLSLAKDIESIMKIVRTVARKITGADGATFVLKDGNFCYYAEEDAISPLWKGNRFPINNCISGWAMLNKKAAVVENIYNDDRIPIDAYRPTFVKSLVVVPIRKMDPIGAIGNYWAQKRQPTKIEISLLQSLADIAAVSIENVNIKNNLEDKLNERTHMLNQLKKQKTQLEEFTHIIAHNLRAPLSNLLLLSNMIEESNLIEEKLSYISKQQPIINHIHETLEELVEAIHVKDDFSLQRDLINLERCVEKAKILLEGEIVASDATITYDFSQVNYAYFPEKYMESIVFNLLSNSVKYRSPDRKPNVYIKSFKDNGWTFLQVRDNGIGIDLEKNKDKIFMLRKTFHQHPDAKGFGLFITRTQIEAMGGSISVESSVGKGSIFTIKLFKNV